MKKTYKIVMLPTDNEKPFTGLVKINSVNPHLGYGDMNNDFHNADHIHPQHLYIISDENVKKGDCVYDSIQKQIKTANLDGLNIIFKWQKVISSTDKDITPNSFIHESFIPVYIKAHNEGKQITEVELESENNYDLYGKNKTLSESNHSNPEPNSILKTNSDGSVIISLKDDTKICTRCGQFIDSHLPEKYLCPEQKMYTPEEVKQKLKDFILGEHNLSLDEWILKNI